MIKDIKDAKRQLIRYFGIKEELEIATKDEKERAINKLAEENCDFYIPDALKWVAKGDNYEKVEKAIDKYGFPKSNGQADLTKAIRYGQRLVNEELLREALKEL